jgi:predicted MFS family arabinose efflux permease
MLALTWGGMRYPWGSAPILGLLAASILLSAAFAYRLLHAAEPLIPLTVLANPVVRAGTLAACFGMGTFIGLTIYVPLYFEAVRGISASQTGLALIPLMVGTVIGATASGRAMARVRHYRRLPVVGLVVSVAATLLLGFGANGLPFGVLEVTLAAISIGLGTLLPVTTVSIQNAVAPHQLGTATATMNFFRQVGGAVLVAAFGAIVIGGAGAGRPGLTLENLAGAGGDAALAGTFRWVFLAAAAGLAAALGFLLAMEERPLRGAPPPADSAH